MRIVICDSDPNGHDCRKKEKGKIAGKYKNETERKSLTRGYHSAGLNNLLRHSRLAWDCLDNGFA
jgi:hypothetical protein